MQTFLPYEDYAKSAAVLDRMRLGKQRVETFQVLQTLLGVKLVAKDSQNNDVPEAQWFIVQNDGKGWLNHPVVKMWKGHELELLKYQKAICNEWTSRGYKDSCLRKSEKLIELYGGELKEGKPSWIGKESVHESHRSNLIRKDDVHYGAIWPKLTSDLEYEWPEV